MQNSTVVSQRTAVPTIRFDATPYTIGTSTILRLPKKASVKLPSRGQVAVQGTINGHQFQTVLEPDGNFGHWMRIDRKLQGRAALHAGHSTTLEIEAVKDWPEPSVPQDLRTALAAAPQKIQDLWKAITPMARWEWVRWVNATPNRGVTFGLAYALDALRRADVAGTEVTLVGGGSASDAWAQLCADIFAMPVARPAIVEAAASGAARQAQWAVDGRRPDAARARSDRFEPRSRPELREAAERMASLRGLAGDDRL